MAKYIAFPIPETSAELPPLPAAALNAQVQAVHRELYSDPKYHALIGYMGPANNAKYKLYEAAGVVLEYGVKKGLTPLGQIKDQCEVLNPLRRALRRDKIDLKSRTVKRDAQPPEQPQGE